MTTNAIQPLVVTGLLLGVSIKDFLKLGLILLLMLVRKRKPILIQAQDVPKNEKPIGNS
jgi:hypothetical protein